MSVDVEEIKKRCHVYIYIFIYVYIYGRFWFLLMKELMNRHCPPHKCLVRLIAPFRGAAGAKGLRRAKRAPTERSKAFTGDLGLDIKNYTSQNKFLLNCEHCITLKITKTNYLIAPRIPPGHFLCQVLGI